MGRTHRRLAAGLAVLACVGALVLAGAGTPRRAHALALVVNSFSDAPDLAAGDGVCGAAPGQCTLRTAIQESRYSPGSTINLPAGTYNLTVTGAFEVFGASGDLNILQDVTIVGAGAETTIIDASATGERVIAVMNNFANVDAEIEGITFRGAMLTVPQAGAGVFSSAHLTLRNCRVENNQSSVAGAGISVDRAVVSLQNTVVSGNRSATAGGGILANAGSTVTIEGGSISGNEARSAGGIFNDGTLAITGTTIGGNSADVEGGGLENFGTMTVTGATIDGNVAVLRGGGLYNGGPGTATLTNSVVSQNSAKDGGGLYSTAGSATLTVERSTIAGNSAAKRGGGIFAESGSLTVKQSTLSGNGATDGGGLFVTTGTATLVLNSTVSANTATADAGGAWIGSDAATMDFTTVAGNTQSPSRGSVYSTNGLTVRHSVIEGGCEGLVTSGGGNVFPEAGCAALAAGDVVGSAGLGPLAANGGPTQTHAIVAGSLAVDRAGSVGCLAVDQRGLPRPRGAACDAGAFELQLGGGTSLPHRRIVAGLARD